MHGLYGKGDIWIEGETTGEEVEAKEHMSGSKYLTEMCVSVKKKKTWITHIKSLSIQKFRVYYLMYKRKI